MYQRLETNEVKSILESKGFRVRSEEWERVRDKSRDGLQKHIVRLYHPDIRFRDGAEIPEIVIQNSYDKTTSVHMMIGIYRLICSNGLIVGNTFGGVSIRHAANVRNKTLDALDVLEVQIKQLEGIIDNQKQKAIVMPSRETLDAIILPSNAINIDHNGYEPTAAFRFQDTATDAWTSFNRVQEKMMRGGIPYRTESGRLMRTRKIQSIRRTISVNKELWNLFNQPMV